jgi:hypothetical protein
MPRLPRLTLSFCIHSGFSRRHASPSEMMDVVVRVLRHSTPIEVLRIWRGEPAPDGRELAASEIAIEWAGRVGHPTSYALLGGVRRGDASRLSTSTSGSDYPDAIAGRNDRVAFGLPEYAHEAVRSVIEEVPFPVEVTLAAHGEVGSSPMAFRWIAALLVALLDLDFDSLSDGEIFDSWAQLKRRIAKEIYPDGS